MKPDVSNVDEKLVAISRGLWINRCLLIFVAICVGMPLFAPGLAVWIAERSDRVWAALSPLAGGAAGILASLLVVFYCAAYVVSKISPPAPAPSDKAPY